MVIEIDLKELTRRGSLVAAETTVDPEAMQKVIVDRGLRGQLDMESLVTGIAHVAFISFQAPRSLSSRSQEGTMITGKSQLNPPLWNRPRGR